MPEGAGRHILLARVAERAERFDEMADFMEQRLGIPTPLNAEERDMFSAAFKNSLTERRHAVRVAVSVARERSAEGFPQEEQLALGYKSKVEAELRAICERCLALLKTCLSIQSAESTLDGEAMAFYSKMTGDYYRYMAEFAESVSRDQAAAQALEAYGQGMEHSKGLTKDDPLRLGLALNFSVFLHEVKKDTTSAISIAREALMGAADEIGSTSEERKADSLLTMQLLQENLALWEAE
mmetsp:Transcript_11215/g.33800  ORF Transcript_11215/g.33800 Transcript_11215/m.33800 type:complete len:239 (-) Transcript_11215:102-818(-)